MYISPYSLHKLRYSDPSTGSTVPFSTHTGVSLCAIKASLTHNYIVEYTHNRKSIHNNSANQPRQ